MMIIAIPLRCDITYPQNVLWTNKKQKHGLDFTKAVLILGDEYIVSFLLYSILKITYIIMKINQSRTSTNLLLFYYAKINPKLRRL